jgi:DEAD/DEAH box helicase domain-containing protein
LSAVTSAAAGHRADACDTLDDLAHEHFERVVANTSLPERVAKPATAAPQLTAPVQERLRARGVETLWSHQAAAVDALRAGRNVVVATGTASGKSLCYQLPIVDSIVEGSRDTTLLVFPTKALAQDQLRSFREWLVPDVVAATYDGDTPTDERKWIRTHANVVLTNP